MSQVRLGEKQIEAIKRFFLKLEKYRIQTDKDEDICVRLFNNSGDVAIFEDETNSYQYYAMQVVKRLVNRGIFYTKVVTNPETGRKVKALCLNRERFDGIKHLVFQVENEITARF